MKLKETEKAYLAGLIDGDGCIYIKVAKKRYFTMRLVLIGTIKEHIEICAKMTGIGSVHQTNRKPPFADLTQWHISSQEALSLLKAVFPYLILKKDQARVAILFQEHLNNSPSYNKWHPIPSQVLNYRMKLLTLLKEMKSSGKTFAEVQGDLVEMFPQEFIQERLI